MDFKTHLITELLGCGYMDVNSLESDMNAFEVDFKDIEIEDGENINSLFGKVYITALNNLDIDPFEDEWVDRLQIYINALDSHIIIDGEEMYSKEDIENFLEKDLDN